MLDGKWSEFLSRNSLQVFFLILGLAIFLAAVIVSADKLTGKAGVEVLESSTEPRNAKIYVELAGAVEKPGVYEFSANARVEDLLIAAGGVSEDADRSWMEKYLNRAAHLTDGQKIYIPRLFEQSTSSSANDLSRGSSVSDGIKQEIGNLININTASSSELDSLPGIGQVYAQKIIDNRPYSTVEDLLSRKILPSATYEKIRDRVSVF